MNKRILLLAVVFGVTTSNYLVQGVSASVSPRAIPGDFVVDITPPGTPSPNSQPDCNPDMLSIGLALMSGQSASTTCVFKTSGTQKSATGTISNPTLATNTSDPGFNNGKLTIVCDFKQEVEISLSISRTDSALKTFSGVVFQACTFSMTFADAKSSTLNGTIEVNGKLGTNDGTVSNEAVAVAIEAKAFVIGGTGAFTGYVGSGTFSQAQEIAIPSAPSSGGGDTPDSPTSDLQTACTSFGISPCTSETIAAFCLANPERCDGRSSVRSMSSRVRVLPSGSDMSLTLVKKAGAVRILTPAPVAGSPTSLAAVKSSTKVRFLASKGAVCTVKTNNGKIVGKATSKGKALNIKPSPNAYKGAKTIQAFCQTKAGKFTSNKVKIKLS
jgi:hypothetical protein